MNPRVCISLQLLLTFSLAQPVTAQQSVYTAAPLLGIYLPTGDLVHDQIVPNPGPLQPETITIGQEIGWSLGLRGARVLTGKLALEVELQYASSQIELRGTRIGVDQITRTLDARVITLGANALYEVFRAPFTPFGIHLLGGLGLVNRAGSFFDEGGGVNFGKLDGGTDVALILGGGFRYGLSPRVGLRLDVRDYLSSYSQSLPGGRLDSELQNDLWITGGLEYAL